MNKIINVVLIILLFISIISAEKKYKSSPEEFYNRVDQIQGFLNSFRNLTIKYLKEKYNEKHPYIYAKYGIKEIKNTHWDMQHIGFDNIPRLLKKEYIIQELIIKNQQIEIARLKKVPGKKIQKLILEKIKIEKKLSYYLNEDNYSD